MSPGWWRKLIGSIVWCFVRLAESLAEMLRTVRVRLLSVSLRNQHHDRIRRSRRHVPAFHYHSENDLRRCHCLFFRCSSPYHDKITPPALFRLSQIIPSPSPTNEGCQTSRHPLASLPPRRIVIPQFRIHPFKGPLPSSRSLDYETLESHILFSITSATSTTVPACRTGALMLPSCYEWPWNTTSLCGGGTQPSDS